MAVMVAQQRGCTWCYWTVHLKIGNMVSSVFWIFYHNKKKMVGGSKGTRAKGVYSLQENSWNNGSWNPNWIGRKWRKGEGESLGGRPFTEVAEEWVVVGIPEQTSWKTKLLLGELWTDFGVEHFFFSLDDTPWIFFHFKSHSSISPILI